MRWGLFEVAAALLAYAALSARLQSSVLSPAIVFVGLGLLFGSEGLDTLGSGVGLGDVRQLAEVTLGLVLFTDASRLDPRALRGESGLPARLLGIGLPLTIVAGSVIALWLFPELLLFEAVVLAVLLAPTDAALGQVVVSDRRLPSRLRQGLNVESGLNDGICVPLLFTAVAFADLEEAPAFEGDILVDLLTEVGVAVAVGALAAAVVGLVLSQARRRGWIEESWGQVIPLSLAVLAYVATDGLGGSGFIATFVAGLLYRQFLGASTAHGTTKLMEELGGILAAVTFFVFGAFVVGFGVTDLDGATVAYAVLSLTVVRMLPVAVSMVRRGAQLPTIAFAGWFGPRGLATIVFMLTIVEESDLLGTDRIVQVAVVTVLLSVVAHGVSAPPLTERYVRWLGTRSERTGVESHEEAGIAHPMPRSLWYRASDTSAVER